MFGQLASLGMFVGLTIAALTSEPLEWTDCSSDPQNTAMTVNYLDVQPNPIQIPGDVHFTLNLTVNKPIMHFFMDTEVYWQGPFGERKLYCFGNRSTGPCQTNDLCPSLVLVMAGLSVVAKSLDHLIDMMLLSALGYRPQCPIHPETVFVDNHKLILSPYTQALGILTNGSAYRLKVMIKEDRSSSDNIGCFEFTTGILTDDNPIVG